MKVTGHDNRGSQSNPYGFVYFDDNSRVGYALGVGPEGPYGLFPFEGPYWNPATSAHVKMAEDYLSTRMEIPE